MYLSTLLGNPEVVEWHWFTKKLLRLSKSLGCSLNRLNIWIWYLMFQILYESLLCIGHHLLHQMVWLVNRSCPIKFRSFLEQIILDAGHFIITGDFNFHVDDQNNSQAATFLDIIHSFNLKQHVCEPILIKTAILST
jgi:hypothetical protein